jgi:hypothetical protein
VIDFDRQHSSVTTCEFFVVVVVVVVIVSLHFYLACLHVMMLMLVMGNNMLFNDGYFCVCETIQACRSRNKHRQMARRSCAVGLDGYRVVVVVGKKVLFILM